LFLFSIPVAIVINIIRVMALVLAFHYFHIDLSAGVLHTITGLVLFILGLVLLFAFQRVLESWETAKKNN
jgi:exosortase/archaeosortase family protein